MAIAILDPFSGIAGDMTLGALVQLGLDPDWLRALPARLGLDGVTVRIADVSRGDLACCKVDFDIPPQPHGRHLKQIRALVAAAGVPDDVRERADAAFTAITHAEAEIHGTTPERVHLHEVGAVDAILDVVGSIWGLALLGVETVYCGPISIGDGFVRAAHGLLPVPAPATLKLLEGLPVRPGPDGSGELVTPTGAALVRVLSRGAPPAYVPTRSGYGAGTKEFAGRANALRIVLAEPAVTAAGDVVESLALVSADVDDMSGEELGACAAVLRGDARVRDVTLAAVQMKKDRPGTRIEILCAEADAPGVEELLFRASRTIGVRTQLVRRRALPRREVAASLDGETLRAKATRLPGGELRVKLEADDVARVAARTGLQPREVEARALAGARAAAEAAFATGTGPLGGDLSHTRPAEPGGERLHSA